ncbi:uncharacterized protein, partial [Solanum tuberosum]|uniref:uncharacterized protein n=1 Tax=Solanum tuberosum TaxID=4113 RepID=UPI00073A2A90
MGSVAHIEDEKKELVCDVHRLARLGVQLVDSTKGGFMVHHISESSFVVDVKSKQYLDPILMELKESVLNKSIEVSPKGEMGVLRYQVTTLALPWLRLKHYMEEAVDLQLGGLRCDEAWKEGELSPQYVVPYRILKCIGKVAYEVDLPNELAPVHPMFHVFLLKKCIGDPISILPLDGLGVDENLSYEEFPDEILDWQVKKLTNKEVDSVK